MYLIGRKGVWTRRRGERVTYNPLAASETQRSS